MTKNRLLTGVWISALAIICVILLGGRYETTSGLNGLVVRTDKMTGEVVACDTQTCWLLLQAGAPVTADTPDSYRF